ncbi:MAG: hypothetical protein ACR2PP_10190 [Psychrobacter sp.]
MKKSEIAMIILIVSVSMMSAFAIANNIPQLKPDDKGVEVEKIDPISAEVDDKPSEEVFNSNAINPTVQTVIGGKQSPQGE